jgi:hypothetical protein
MRTNVEQPENSGISGTRPGSAGPGIGGEKYPAGLQVLQLSIPVPFENVVPRVLVKRPDWR